MDTNELKIGVLCLVVSVALYYFNKQWVADKKQREELDTFDKGTVIPKAWLLIILFGSIGLFNILNYSLIYKITYK